MSEHNQSVETWDPNANTVQDVNADYAKSFKI